MSAESVMFIGGILDGEKKYINVHERPVCPAPPMMGCQQRYDLKWITTCDGTRHYVYARPGIDWVDDLFKYYRKRDMTFL